MSILFHRSANEFHLTNGKVSYILGIMENGRPQQLYYGKAVHDRASFAHLQELVCFGNTDHLGGLAQPMDMVRHEYPAFATGDFRSHAFRILQENGSCVSDFTYRSHTIKAGKAPILPLPSTYTEDDSQAETLEILLHDDVTDTDLTLTYTIFSALPVITRHAVFTQKGAQKIVLDRAMSLSVDFCDKDFEMIHLAGAWARERYVKTRRLESGLQSIQSTRGASSSEHNPFLALKRPHTTEYQGEVYGFSLVYSGNFLAQVEVDTYEQTRVMMGIHPETFAWNLCQGESFITPEVVMVYSDRGLNGMSQAFHRLYRDHLMRSPWKNQARPILLNNWEATYFFFDEEKILNIASKAKEAGVELFVLDDGWFGTRNNDHEGLGDWYVNTDKLPNGIKGLSEKIEALGLKFGLWVELEMVNKNSDLFRAHPDWIIQTPGRFQTPGRNQHVLDFSRKEVVDAIYAMIAPLLRESRISYIKWDMNRYITEPYSACLQPDEQGMLYHKYILGVYDLYARLTSEFPHILFESCASGGARFDPAMLYFAPQTWCSDDTDAHERCKIQYGTSYVYPLVSMGSHVSAVPNHQVLRSTPIATRASVAYFGTFGYELDLNLLSDEEFEQVREQIRFMKKYRNLIQVDGDFYRLVNPFEQGDTSWMVVSGAKDEALVLYYQPLNRPNHGNHRLRLEGLDPDTRYEITLHTGRTSEGSKAFGHAWGDELMYTGLPIPHGEFFAGGGDFTSVLFTLKAES